MISWFYFFKYFTFSYSTELASLNELFSSQLHQRTVLRIVLWCRNYISFWSGRRHLWRRAKRCHLFHVGWEIPWPLTVLLEVSTKKAWEIINADLLRPIQSFMSVNTRQLNELNIAHICLIPKKGNPSKADNYMPISLMHSFCQNNYQNSGK